MVVKDHHQNIKEELERFVELAPILDLTTRQYLVEYLKSQLFEDTPLPPKTLHMPYYQYFSKALEDLLAVQDVLALCREYDGVNEQVVKDLLLWIKKTYRKIEVKNPHKDEINRLKNWSINPLRIAIERRHHLVNYLSERYRKVELNIDFYQQKLEVANRAIQQAPNSDETIDLLSQTEFAYRDLLAQWDARLQAKVLAFQLTVMTEEKEEFESLLSQKVLEFKQINHLISPFADYLGRYWDLSGDCWQDASFDLIQKYNELLKNEKSIQELADLLGQMREAEIETQEEAFEKTIIRQEWVKDPFGKAEIGGVHESDDLNNLLSSEAALLSNSDTEWLFLKKYADKNLLTFQYEEKKLVHNTDHFMEINQKVKLKEKGPFIVCIDTSESMYGMPEQIAKVLCLAILKMAGRENRKAYLINFSTGIKTIDLLHIADSIDKIADFLQMSFYGGTDVSLALYEAIRQLKGQSYQDADVLVISDFIMYKINKDVLRDIRYFQQDKGTQFHSLTLSDDPNSLILDSFDTNWIYDPKEKGIVKELRGKVQGLMERG